MIEDIKLTTGLALIRYEAKGGRSNAIIRAHIPTQSRDNLTLITDPNAQSDVLAEPGDCWVVRCQRPAILSLEIESIHPGEPARAGVMVEYLGEKSAQKWNSSSAAKRIDYRDRNAASSQYRSEPSYEDRVIAHIANVGDVTVKAGDWARGNGANQTIEGLLLPAENNVNIVVRDANTGQVAHPGQFLGSRGRARPLTRLEIWIDGPDRDQRIEVEALYERAGFCKEVGSAVEISGLDDSDALIGLKLHTAGAEMARSGSFYRDDSQSFGNGQRPARSKLFKR
ncbi:hypothetical protein [Donghicola sp. XS_ASV15]|uniref:hypothetical protein n=1 Tax=Donghicola sp. XS_ASV15 TaxID=3241295 RepID=UPI003514AF19